MKDLVSFKGELTIIKKTGEKIEEMHKYNNLITDTGMDYLKKLIGGDNFLGINKLAVGDGDTASSILDVKLANKKLLLDVSKDYSFSDRINFMAIIPENTFSQIVNYKEAGLVVKTSTSEILVSRLVFDDVIYQKPENSLSFLYSLLMTRM